MIWKPWSFPVSLGSNQRRNNSCPGSTWTPVSGTLEKTTRLASAFPSSAPTVVLVTGLIKSKAEKAVHVKAAAAAAKSAQFEQLSTALSRQIHEGQIEISELRGKMTVKLKDKILFASGSAKLSKEGGAALDAVADAFKDLKGKNVVVAGYTDDVPVAGGAYKDNWELSSARAIAVVRYLASKGVPPEMLGAAGFSEFRPVVANDTPANRSQNRRIEIALTAADYEPPVVEAK